ncbi:methyltransferase type 11 [Bacillus sp. FJAT-27225]|uniref:class I SAM-dependent methyltransferase n=1 Tax=Bacillus sp. FJAT-27225 TaxID=1743144 RepID=UPI00080C2609|nr:class I SAM-dependent methyltransferase [Bacillus sp. FJAT-27225]OCA90334.1 methyltransferase type 11 [Bacillus sp. FJAT-27225]
MNIMNPATLEGWLQPHSIEWYKQLSNLQGKYTYTWNSTLTEPNGESVFDEEVTQLIVNKKVLDVGCGHGEFTLKCSLAARTIVGFDATDNFINTGLQNNNSNVSFVVGNTKDGLPFKPNEFDCAYVRKGPTSSYPYLNKVVTQGGKIMGLHPGDELAKELPLLFPNLFETSNGTPILDTLYKKLELSNFSYSTIEVKNSIEYIGSPMDVLKLRCFGQQPFIFETLKEKYLLEISKVFEQNSTEEGLPVTHSRYIVRATV